MKTNKEKVFDFIVEYSKRFKTINDETPKLDTQFLFFFFNTQTISWIAPSE